MGKERFGLRVLSNLLSHINCNYVISFDYLDNLLKRMSWIIILKIKKKINCIKRIRKIQCIITIVRRIWTTSKKNNINKKTLRFIKLYICKYRESEITFSNCLIFRKNKLSTIKFR